MVNLAVMFGHGNIIYCEIWVQFSLVLKNLILEKLIMSRILRQFRSKLKVINNERGGVRRGKSSGMFLFYRKGAKSQSLRLKIEKHKGQISG